MPVLLPFRAFFGSTSLLYVPGEETPCPLDNALLIQQGEPALYLYRQQFQFSGDRNDSVREGVMSLLNRDEAQVLPHEETEPNRVSACVTALQSGTSNLGSLWLWCDDADGLLKSVMTPTGPACLEATDRFACLHQFWPIRCPERINEVQTQLAGKPLFLADGHHRFAAGWNLATIQLRSSSLRSLPSHRLIMRSDDLRLPSTQLIEDCEGYLASAPAGHWRLVIVRRGPIFEGVELPNTTSVKELVGNAAIEPVRTISGAIATVQAGYAQIALLVPPFSTQQIEARARNGLLLPPKSTDFFPKLAAGLVIHLPQKENTSPPVAQIPGVRNPSS